MSHTLALYRWRLNHFLAHCSDYLAAPPHAIPYLDQVLPIELIDHISGYLSLHDIIHLSQVSRGLRDKTVDTLRRNQFTVTSNDTYATNAVSLLKVLLRHPEVGDRICRLNLDHEQSDNPWAWPSSVQFSHAERQLLAELRTKWQDCDFGPYFTLGNRPSKKLTPKDRFKLVMWLLIILLPKLEVLHVRTVDRAQESGASPDRIPWRFNESMSVVLEFSEFLPGAPLANLTTLFLHDSLLRDVASLLVAPNLRLIHFPYCRLYSTGRPGL